MTNFWTPASCQEFHHAVARLRQRTEIPAKPCNYYNDVVSDLELHVLSFKDELQIADGLAFLAHHDESVDCVSAVTVQEHSDGLSVVLASNSTPSEMIGDGLRAILGLVSQYARMRRSRQQFCNEIFRETVQLSAGRILGRIRPPWVRPPDHVKKKRHYLRTQLSEVASGHTMQSLQLARFREEIRKLVNLMDPLDEAIVDGELTRGLEPILLKCADIARIAPTRSVEEFLKSLGLPAKIYEMAEMRQIDKLARYLFFCQDLTRLARKPQYRNLFDRFTVILLTASEGYTRPGLRSQCFVHAEIQQILHHEKQQSEPAPRAIGCSKSACYLCDAFIQEQGRYRISSAHGRLYEKWTIPDVYWMTEGQASSFAIIIEAVMKQLERDSYLHAGKRQDWVPYPLESRAFLPLPLTRSGSTIAETASGSCKMVLSAHNLPFCGDIHDGISSLELRLNQLHFWFEFPANTLGQLTIRLDTSFDQPSELRTFEALEIPATGDVNIGQDMRTLRTTFRIRNGPTSVEIDWDHRFKGLLKQRA